MNYPEDARSLALATGFQALVISLYEAGALHPQNFLDNIAAGHRSLVNSGNEVAAAALQDVVEPLAGKFGFRWEPSD